MPKPMDKNLVPKNVYLREMKENLDSNPIGHHKERIKKELLDKWRKIEANPELEPIFLFEEDYNSISAYAIEIHKETSFESNLTSEKNQPNVLKKETSFYVRIPMMFFDFAIEIDEIEEPENSIIFVDSKEDEEILSKLTTGFNEMENIHIVGRHMISRGVIINSIKAFCQNMNIVSMEFRITKKRVHFVDSTNGIVYKGIRSCLEEMFGIDKDEIQIIIEKEASS